MKTPTIVMADLHAQKRNLKEIECLFDKLPWYCLEHGHAVHSMVIVGDVFHSVSQIETEVYISVYKCLEKLKKDLDWDIRIVQGNHDIYMTDVSPLIPFASVCRIYTSAEVDGPFEFLPYRNNMNWEMSKDPGGVTFVHFTLNKILAAMKGSYSIPFLTPPSNERLYLAGHIHLPLIRGNQVSLGSPLPFMFDNEPTESYIYILDEDLSLYTIPTNISTYQVIEVKSREDLKKAKINYGDVSTWVKFKLLTDEVSHEELMEFKKEHNIGVVVSNEVKAGSTTGKLDVRKADNPLQVYKQFLQNTETPHNKRELYGMVVETLRNEDLL